jgi:nucleotide-binding universal stress UspA family protein
MTKILVGFDGSDGARDALRLGKALGRAEDAELLVGAVISYVPLPIEAEAYERALSEHYDELFDAVQQELAGARSSGMNWPIHLLPAHSVSSPRIKAPT